MYAIKYTASLLFIIFSTLYGLEANEWSHSSGSYKSERFYKGNQITPSNINDLVVAWKYSSGKIDERLTVQASPIFTGNKIISSSPQSLSALDPVNGNVIWTIDLDYKINPRGITFINKPNRRIYVPTQRGILELNEENGAILGYFDSGATSVAPIITDKKIIIATYLDGIKAFDLNSKEQIWHTSLEMNNYKASVWSGFSFDPETQLAYVMTGSYGGLMGWYRKEPNLESNIIAVDVLTGKIEWRFQFIEHDLWDLDLMGNPILLDLNKNGKTTKALVALNKKGDVILLNAINGEPFHENSIKMIEVENSDIPREKTADFQKKFLIPEPFHDVYVDISNDFKHLNASNKEFVDKKIRHAKSGVFLPPSLNHDILMYGINGGANLSGGAIDFSGKNPSVIVPFNSEAWILRAFYTDKANRLIEELIGKYKSFKSNGDEEKTYQDNCASCHDGGHAPSRMIIGKMPADKIYASLTNGVMAAQAQNLSPQSKKELAEYLGSERQQMAENVFTSMPFVPKNETYIQNCSSCHGLTRKGYYEYESQGDKYYPPLVGISLTDKNIDVEQFNKIKSIHEYFDISYDISKQEHHEIFTQFAKYDSWLEKLGLLSSRGFWQLLLDKDGYPANKPPWGGIAKIDLVTGKKIWSIPMGVRLDEEKNKVANGDKNFGGVLTIGSGLIFATGTPNPLVYAYDNSGNQVWSDEISYAGSVAPISYEYGSCQFILFTATGGKVIPFSGRDNGDELIAYKLRDCKS
jgi:quinoprotein glucose dehydrogenase